MLQSAYRQDWPYLTNELPGIGGQLRAALDDFIVEEIPLYEPSGEGQHLYVSLTKSGMTTKDLQHELARLFQIDRRDVGFAGMKDKHARTTQTVSLGLGADSAARADQVRDRITAELPVTVHWAKAHGNKLRPGHLLGNRFTITISDLQNPMDEILDKVQPIVARIHREGLPNYFGPQRFGINGANVAKGHEVLLRKRYIKDRWLRRFLVSAYQSYLCNLYLARRLELELFGVMLVGDVAKKVDTGGIFEVDDVATDQQRYDGHEISFTAPMFGAKMRVATHAAGELEEQILTDAGLDVHHFARAKVDGTRRLGRLLVPDLALVDESDQYAARGQLTVAFTLPKGAFATTVLRELMKVDVSYIPDDLE